MLFSDPGIYTFINDSFEPVWLSLRPVPIVKIDFRNGHVIKRTLQGNVATLICAADGQVLDILPGLYSAQGYLDQIRRLADLSLVVNRPSADRAGFLRQYYNKASAAEPDDIRETGRENNDSESASASAHLNKLRGLRPGTGEFGRSNSGSDSKVNSSSNTGPSNSGSNAGNSGLFALGRGLWQTLSGHKPAPVAVQPPPPKPAAPTPIMESMRMMGKAAGQRVVKEVINPTYNRPYYEQGEIPASVKSLSPQDTAQWEALIKDTQINESLRKMRIHVKLAFEEQHNPESITKWLYKEVLDTDLDDPYLGLGKQLFDTYPFEK